MPIGCARVATQDQNLESQREALTRAGCQQVFEVRRTVQAGHRVQGSDRRHSQFALQYLAFVPLTRHPALFSTVGVKPAVARIGTAA